MRKQALLISFLLIGLSAGCSSTKHSRIIQPLPAGVTAPVLIGGKQQLLSNLEYPYKARENNAQGRVVVLFLVTETGKVKNIRIAEGERVGSGVEVEAKRLVRLADYEPARDADGNPIAVEYHLAITFRLQ